MQSRIGTTETLSNVTIPILEAVLRKGSLDRNRVENKILIRSKNFLQTDLSEKGKRLLKNWTNLDQIMYQRVVTDYNSLTMWSDFSAPRNEPITSLQSLTNNT